MDKFPDNSCPNIIVFSDAPYKIVHKDNFYDMDFEFDTVQISDIYSLEQYFINYKRAVDMVVIQCKNISAALDSYLEGLPVYYASRVAVYNDWDNHAKDLYDILYRQMSGKCDPTVSFITPLYKTSERYFYELYEMLKKQTLNDWEWILVDDSPIGEECKFVKESAGYDKRLYYYRIEPSRGNIGLSKWRANCMSTGKWLMELDHDDIILPFTVAYIEDAARQYPDAGFIYSSNANLDGNGEFIDKIWGDEWGYMFGKNDYVFCEYYNKEIPFIHTPINECTMLDIISAPNHLRCWRRDIYFKIGGHSQYYRACDDYELMVRTFLETKFIHIMYPLYIQRYEGQNTQYQSSNIIDINIRKVYIVNFYYNSIKKMFKERYGIDIIGNTAEESIIYYSNNPDQGHNVEYIY